MAGTNEFIQFAYGGGAYVRTNAQWSAEAALRLTGFPPGLVLKEDMNKALRQGTAMAAAIGQFIADQGQNALDDGNVATLDAAFTAANTALITTIATNIATSIAAQAVPSFLIQKAGII